MCTYLFLCAHAPSSLMMMTTWSHSFSIIFSLNFIIIIIIFFGEEKILKKLTIWFAYYKTCFLDCLEEVWNCNCSANCWKTIQFFSSKILMFLMLCSILFQFLRKSVLKKLLKISKKEEYWLFICIKRIFKNKGRSCYIFVYVPHMYYNKIRVKFSSSMNLAGDRTLTLWGVL